MRKAMVIGLTVLLAIAGAGSVRAEVKTNITDFLSNYKFVTNNVADVGTTGLTQSNAYLCLDLSDISNLSMAQATESGASSSFQTLVYAVVKHFYDSIQALASTNRPTKMTISERVQSSSSGDLTVSHVVKTELNIGTATVVTTD